jgi:transposase
MMGRQIAKRERIVALSLEDYVPPNHLLCLIDRFLDLRDFRGHLASLYSHIGRPSIDPELMIRMLIIGYCYGIRSERRLCEEVQLNLAYRWFCRLDLQDPVPEHSSFSKNRHSRFRDSEAFRHLFEKFLSRCIAEGLGGGEGFAIDASTVRADASRQKRSDENDHDDCPGAGPLSRAVKEYLAALEATNPPEAARKISLTDSASRWTAAPGGPAFFAYSTNYLIDLQATIIVDVEATPALRSDEVACVRTMIDRVEQRFDIRPHRLVGDTAYGTAPLLGWMVNDKHIEPHVPVWDKSERQDGSLSRSDFTYDPEEDCYRCPIGVLLHTIGQATADDTLPYRASKFDCNGCARKPVCCPNMPVRKIPRSIHEAARDVARSIGQTKEYRDSRRHRKKVEMLFAHLKRILKLDRLRLRGLSGAHDEFLLAGTVQNLRRLAKTMEIASTRGEMQFARAAGRLGIAMTSIPRASHSCNSIPISSLLQAFFNTIGPSLTASRAIKKAR